MVKLQPSRFRSLLTGLAMLATSDAFADTLELQDGVVVVGLYMGGTEDSIRFKIHEDVRVYRRQEVKQLSFAPVALEAPPPPRSEQPGPPPAPGRVWVSGHWQWRDLERRYVWVDGHWEASREGFTWVPGHWERRPWGWVWTDGRWQRP